MSKRDRGFLDIPRKDPGYRRRETRLQDWRPVERMLTSEELRDQAARCMDCGTPFCHGCGCPLQNMVPELNVLAYHGRWREAWELLENTHPMPEITARICPALCEGACVAGLHGEPVAIRQIERMIVEHAFESELVKPKPPAVRHDARVAVVGSGPAGLAAADRLNRAGYPTTVFESAAKPGGILRYGIPDFKLEKWILDRRIQRMVDEGIQFETGVDVGVDVSPHYLLRRYPAVILAGGAREPRDLDVPGRELDGIHFAMPFLTQQNRRNDGEAIPDEETITARDRIVTVIGGGDTGSDCLGTALRQGARKVYQFEILPRPPLERSPATPWPEWPLRFRESSSQLEGGERRWSVMTRRLEGIDGRVVRLHACEVEWIAGKNGRTLPRPVKGSDFAVDTDLVLLALGFTGSGRHPCAEALDLARDPQGMIQRDARQMTSQRGVFITGDMATGASLVVRAIAHGIQVAGFVEDFLREH